MGDRWMPEHVVALAPDPASTAAARRLVVPARWSGTGCDDAAVWGSCHSASAEPYQVVVELAEPTTRCTCPSRKLPCKHAIALLLLWAQHQIAGDDQRPSYAAAWLARRAAARAARQQAPAFAGGTEGSGGPDCDGDRSAAGNGRSNGRGAHPAAPASHEATTSPDPERTAHADGIGPVAEPPRDRRADERAARVAAGLGDLDRWLTDCIRTGLAAPPLSRYATWDEVAARLVDAQAPSLANRVRRLAGRVGTSPGWHEHVLAELGVLHLLAASGARPSRLPEDLAAGVRTAVGWAVRRDDVLDAVPVTDRWWVAGRSDAHEDRLVVRRTWLRGRESRRWAMILSFAAYGQALDASLPVGSSLTADVHFYPGACPLRALVSVVHEPPVPDPTAPPATTLAEACAQIGNALVAEPWLERLPATIQAAPTLDRGGWLLADETGALVIAGAPPGLAALVALSGGRRLALTVEWTADGLLPVAAHVPGRTVDLGPDGPWGRG